MSFVTKLILEWEKNVKFRVKFVQVERQTHTASPPLSKLPPKKTAPGKLPLEDPPLPGKLPLEKMPPWNLCYES